MNHMRYVYLLWALLLLAAVRTPDELLPRDFGNSHHVENSGGKNVLRRSGRIRRDSSLRHSAAVWLLAEYKSLLRLMGVEWKGLYALNTHSVSDRNEYGRPGCG